MNTSQVKKVLGLAPLFAAALATSGSPCDAAELTRKYGDVVAGGIQVHYFEAGSGRPLVLLHMFGWSGKAWEPFLPALAKSRRVIVLDLPGHGGSTGWKDLEHFDYPLAAKRMLAALNALGVDSFDAIGASSGSIVLMHMAVSEPRRIERMIALSTTPFVGPVTLKWLEENACPPDTEEDILDSLKYSVQGRQQVAALSRAFCNERTNPFHILDAQLATFSGEVLFVHGDRDPIMPVELAFAMSRSVPRSYIWVEPGGTHIFPMKSEQARERFLAIADAFFGGRRGPQPH
jgi:pimeloyl-ACP methyl ester carboxylesterase